jgi:hypothetical protein
VGLGARWPAGCGRWVLGSSVVGPGRPVGGVPGPRVLCGACLANHLVHASRHEICSLHRSVVDLLAPSKLASSRLRSLSRDTDARGGIPWWCGYLVCCRDAEGRRVPLAGFENARGKLTGHVHHYALSGLGRRPRQGADAGTRRWTPSHRTVLAAWSKRSGSTAAGPRRRRSTSMRRPADQLCRHAWGRISLLFRPAPADVQPC